jgi:hypothetical protein
VVLKGGQKQALPCGKFSLTIAIRSLESMNGCGDSGYLSAVETQSSGIVVRSLETTDSGALTSDDEYEEYEEE